MRNVLMLTMLLALSVPVPGARAVPPAAGGALASANVDFVANIPDVPAIGGRILRGVDTLLGTKDLFYLTTGQGLRIYDVTAGVPVPLGALELPHFENEDADTNGQILLISADHFLGFPNMLYVIDVSNPSAPLLKSTIPFTDEAHTVTCINGCSYAWIAGGRGVVVVDLRDPANPRQIGRILGDENDPSYIGGTHDVQVDEAGIAWITGSTLTGWETGDPRTPSGAPYPSGGSPRAPVLFARQDGYFNNNFILHNSLRPNALSLDPATLSNSVPDPGEAVFVTEEDYITINEDGSFQAGFLRYQGGSLIVDHSAKWTFGNDLQAGTDHKIGVGFSSSHYFDFRDGVMAVAWYEQGTRFFDVSDFTSGTASPEIRPIGYFMPAAGNETWNVVFNGDWIYTIDFGRGIDVLHFTGTTSSTTVDLPRVDKTPITPHHPLYGACRLGTPMV